MRARGGGRIVNIGSTSQLKGTVGLVHYSASKGAVAGLTRALARELGPDNILVNQVAPGFTLSDGVAGHLDGKLVIDVTNPLEFSGGAPGMFTDTSDSLVAELFTGALGDAPPAVVCALGG